MALPPPLFGGGWRVGFGWCLPGRSSRRLPGSASESKVFILGADFFRIRASVDWSRRPHGE